MSSTSTYQPARKRQFGAERRTEPLPTVHPRPSDRKITFSRIAIVLTVSFWVIYVVTTIIRQFLDSGTQNFRFTIEAIGYVVVVTFLTFSALMYLIARQGALQRFSKHVRVPRAELDRHFADHQSSMTVLVPSYAEEPQVVRATLLSAALQEYPSLRVVLLLDDDPYPADSAVAGAARTRPAPSPATSWTLLAEPRRRFSDALLRFELERSEAAIVDASEARALADEYAWAAGWLRDAGRRARRVDDHVDVFFADQVLRALADELAARPARRVDGRRRRRARRPSADRVHELYRRLAWTFDAELAVFERKKYASLSHEANKAMNLNSYIGLMGGTYRLEETPDGTVLKPVADRRPGDIRIPDSDYLLTLDADSILLRDYCLRLVYLLRAAGERARRRDADAVLVVPRCRHAHRAPRRRDHRHPAHPAPGHVATTAPPSGSARTRSSASARSRTSSRPSGRRLRGHALRAGPHRHRGHRVEHRPRHPRLDARELPGAPQLQRHAARLRLADRAASPLGERRPAHPAEALAPGARAQAPRRARLAHRAAAARQLHGLDRLGELRPLFLLAYPYDSRLLSPVVLLAAVPYFLAMASDLRYAGYKALGRPSASTAST